MPQAGLEPVIPAIHWPQTVALDRSATGSENNIEIPHYGLLSVIMILPIPGLKIIPKAMVFHKAQTPHFAQEVGLICSTYSVQDFHLQTQAYSSS